MRFDLKKKNLAAYSWAPSTVHSTLPPGALYAGSDSDGTQIFVGRTFFQGDQLPCKIIPNKNAAYVSYDGGEHFVETYEVKSVTIRSDYQEDNFFSFSLRFYADMDSNGYCLPMAVFLKVHSKLVIANLVNSFLLVALISKEVWRQEKSNVLMDVYTYRLGALNIHFNRISKF